MISEKTRKEIKKYTKSIDIAEAEIQEITDEFNGFISDYIGYLESIKQEAGDVRITHLLDIRDESKKRIPTRQLMLKKLNVIYEQQAYINQLYCDKQKVVICEVER